MPVNTRTQPTENSPPELAQEGNSEVIWEGLIVYLVDCVLSLSENYVKKKKKDQVNQALLFSWRPICVHLLLQILVIVKMYKNVAHEREIVCA